jgi:hypothetical protein
MPRRFMLPQEEVDTGGVAQDVVLLDAVLVAAVPLLGVAPTTLVGAAMEDKDVGVAQISLIPLSVKYAARNTTQPWRVGTDLMKPTPKTRSSPMQRRAPTTLTPAGTWILGQLIISPTS